MADLAASVASVNIQQSTTPQIKIKVIDFDFDPEIVTVRTVTSDNYSSSPTASCPPRTVNESAGGIIRASGYVDPSDATTALILASAGTNGLATATYYDFDGIQFVLDNTQATGSLKGYYFGVFGNHVKLYIRGISGVTDDGGMLLMRFEIHSQVGVLWSTTLVSPP